MKKTLLCAACLGTLLGFAGTLPAFELVKGGKTAEIVLPENAHPSSKLAAKEIADYTEKVTGKRPAVVTGKSNAADQILIGTLDTMKNVPSDIVSKLEGQESKESAVIQAKKNVLYIVGKFEVAEMYASCHFIEDKLGVRWFKPANESDSGEYVPKKEQIVFGDYTQVRAPWAFHRALDQCGTGGTISRLTKTWANRNGMQTPIVWGGKINYQPRTKREKEIYEFYAPRIPHYLQQLSPDNHSTFGGPFLPLKKTFAEHPEYFALVGGKRACSWQICIGNTDVQKKVAQAIVSRLDKEQGNGMFTFGMVDVATGWCECEKCRALDKNDPNASFRDVSTRFFNAVNPIAKMVWEKYPQADLRTWAYSAYRRIPYKTQLDPRLKVQFATHGRCWGHELDDPNCPINAPLYKQMLDWRRYFPGKMYTYEYFFCSSALYTCAEMTLANTLKLYKKMGYTGWKEQGYFEDNIQYRPHFSADRPHLYPSNWQLVYLAAKLLWDPDQDPVKLLEEAESLYYGKAYEVMKKYHALRRELWKSAKSCMGYPIGNPRAGFLLNRQGAKEQLLAYLAEAGKLAEGDKVLQYRIGRDKYWLENYWIKPNELLHSDSGKHLFAPMANSKITVDGSGEEKAWQEAFYIDNFCWIFGKRKGTAVPKELKTTVGILADKENLYFLITAMEPSPEKMASTEGRDSAVWAKDCIEIFLYPPSVENTYYQLAIGPTGTVFDAIQPGTRQSFDLDVEVRTKILKDRYVIEARIPAAKLFPLKAGDVWRVHVSRGRSVSDGFCKGETLECFSSLSGIPQKSFTRFRSMDIGMKNPEEFVNGDFNKVRKMNDTQKRIYKGLNRTYVNGVWAPPWLLNDKGAMELRLHPDSRDDYFVKLDGTLYQIHYGRARDYTVTFRAKGNGKLAAKYFRYHYLPETKGKLKYISTGAGIPSMVLAPEWKEYRYEVHKEFDDEIFAPVFTRLSGEVFIDDVKVTEGPRLLYHNEIKTKK